MDLALQHHARRLAGLAARRPGFALGVWGEAGVGKTHTALALLRGLPCRSATVRAPVPLRALLLTPPRPRGPGAWLEQALEQVQGGREAELADPAAVLSALLAASAPFLLHVEDLHEATPARADFWRQLARTVTRTRGVGLLVTSRSEPPEPFEAARLRPLDRPGSDALLEAEAGARLPAGALAWIWGRAAGNPLFTLEYFRFLARRGFAWNDGHAWHWREPEGGAVPLAVEALIEHMLMDAAGTPALEAALAAQALLGPGMPEQTWAEVAGLSAGELGGARAELERAGVLFQGEFAHPLYREVTLRHLPAARRQLFARRALEVPGLGPREAVRFAPDAGLGPQETLACFLRAAQAARAAGSDLQAARLLGQAADYASGERRAELALQAARGLRKADLPEALRLAQVVLAGEPGNREAITLAASLTAARGLLAEADAILGRLPPEQAGGSVGAGQRLVLRALSGDYAGAAEVWRASPALPASMDAEVLYQAAFSLSAVGEQGAALDVLTRGLGLPGLSDEQRCKLVSVQAALCYRRADYPGQEAFSREALALARASGQAQAVARTLFNRHYALGMLGRFGEMRLALEEAGALFAQIGEHRRYAHTQVRVADLLTACGEYGRAEELLLEARDILTRLDVSEPLVDCQKALVDLYTSWPVPHAPVLALKHAQDALETARALNSPRNVVSGLLAVSSAQTAQDQASPGLDLAEQALRLAQDLGLPWAVFSAQAHRARALEGLGRTGEAAATYGVALELAGNLGIREEQASVGLELDRLNGDAAGLTRGLAFFEERGLTGVADRAREYLRQLAGVHVAVPATPPPRLEVLGDLRCSGGGPDGGPDGGAARPVRGRRRQELLALLAGARLAGRASVSRPDLLDALYPGTAETQAGAALRDLVHQVRADFGPGVVLTTEGGYALGDLRIDAAEFLSGGETRLWRGPYLAGLSLETHGETVEAALYLALRGRAEALLMGDPGETARLGRLLLEADPYDLGALSLTLRALRAGGDHRGLGREYVRAQARLLEVGEVLPGSWAQFLAAPVGAPA